MDNKFLEFYNGVQSHIELGISLDAKAFCEGCKGLKSYNIQKGENESIEIDMELNDFSIPAAKNLFCDFFGFVGYIGINMSIGHYTNSELQYLFLTSIDGVEVTKMKINIR